MSISVKNFTLRDSGDGGRGTWNDLLFFLGIAIRESGANLALCTYRNVLDPLMEPTIMTQEW